MPPKQAIVSSPSACCYTAATSCHALVQIDAVNKVLEDLGVENMPVLNVWNKVSGRVLKTRGAG